MNYHNENDSPQSIAENFIIYFMVLKMRVSGMFIVSSNFEVDQVHKSIQKKLIDLQRDSFIKET